ncbi:hypothetical protein CAMSH0001_1643 [Campylobacter showae RM3277]|uniref:Uncharacterized protein n=1 Tax=Campylobacter showae RM3277 TaxID=553219 RepID=C6RH09_9BACT|nr:hypothetical protein CAMSH0001_1643 [Campylobacter showae RM3277]
MRVNLSFGLPSNLPAAFGRQIYRSLNFKISLQTLLNFQHFKLARYIIAL